MHGQSPVKATTKYLNFKTNANEVFKGPESINFVRTKVTITGSGCLEVIAIG